MKACFPRCVPLVGLLLSLLLSVAAVPLHAQDDYDLRRARSYLREAEYYEKRAASYLREAEYYEKRAASARREAAYWLRRGDDDRAKTYMERFEDAIERRESSSAPRPRRRGARRRLSPPCRPRVGAMIRRKAAAAGRRGRCLTFVRGPLPAARWAGTKWVGQSAAGLVRHMAKR